MSCSEICGWPGCLIRILILNTSLSASSARGGLSGTYLRNFMDKVNSEPRPFVRSDIGCGQGEMIPRVLRGKRQYPSICTPHHEAPQGNEYRTANSIEEYLPGGRSEMHRTQRRHTRTRSTPTSWRHLPIIRPAYDFT